MCSIVVPYTPERKQEHTNTAIKAGLGSCLGLQQTNEKNTQSMCPIACLCLVVLGIAMYGQAWWVGRRGGARAMREQGHLHSSDNVTLCIGISRRDYVRFVSWQRHKKMPIVHLSTWLSVSLSISIDRFGQESSTEKYWNTLEFQFMGICVKVTRIRHIFDFFGNTVYMNVYMTYMNM